VIVFGTIALGLVSLGQIAFLRTADRRPLTLRQGLGYLLTLVPLIVAFVAPSAELGALAASRKLVSDQAGPIVFPEERPGRVLSFIDLDLASRAPGYAEAAGIEGGDNVELIGFVTHGGESGAFDLTRFYISCCAADAIPYSVRVVHESATRYSDDTWLKVAGTVEEESGGYVLRAAHIEEVDEPDPPYLY